MIPGPVVLSAADAQYIFDAVVETKVLLADVGAYVLNAREALAEARSTVVDHLSGPNDIYAKVAILQDIDAADDNLRRALL